MYVFRTFLLSGAVVAAGARVVSSQPADSLATITTDTGAFAPGNKEFTRFTTPGMCIGAANVALDLARRSTEAQLAHAFEDSVFGGTAIPVTAVRVARTCSARFSIAGTAPGDLKDLFILMLMAGNDSLARAVTARRVALATNNGTRAEVLQDAITQYLRAEPARITAAEATAAEIDALGTSVQIARLDAHAQLLQYGMSKFNEPYMRREAERIIALGREVPVRPIQYHFIPIVTAYIALGQIAYVEAPDSVLPVMARAKDDLGRFPSGDEWPSGMPVPMLEAFAYRTASVAAVRDFLLPFNADQYADRPLPAVEATYWFPAQPTAWPPGKDAASLIVYGGFLAGDCVRSDWSLLEWTLRRECVALRTLVPSWTQQYGSRFSLTLVAQTQGSAVRSAVLSPKAEADSVAWYLRHYLALSATIGVVLDSIHAMPPVDGRQLHVDPTFYGRKFKDGVVLLYGPGGKLIYQGSAQLDDPVLRKLVVRELQALTPGQSHTKALRSSRPASSAGSVP